MFYQNTAYLPFRPKCVCGAASWEIEMGLEAAKSLSSNWAYVPNCPIIHNAGMSLTQICMPS